MEGMEGMGEMEEMGDGRWEMGDGRLVGREPHERTTEA